MNRKFLSIICLLLCFSTLLASCVQSNTSQSQAQGEPGIEQLLNMPYVVPENLMTVEQYQTEVQNLLKGQNFITATDEYLANIERLGDGLRDSIIYSTNDITECTGTKYYISNNGNDSNNGKSPETAWATLGKLKTVRLKAGDLVLLERGSMWRETLPCVNGVTYSAYGEGYKPRVWNSVNGLKFEWVQTETPNVWKYDPEEKGLFDVGVVVYDYGNSFGQQKSNIEGLKKQGDFVYLGTAADIEKEMRDYCLYVYSEKNPKEFYKAIDIAKSGGTIKLSADAKNITVNNLEMLYGINFYFLTNPQNIVVSDCIFGWQGGQTEASTGVRYGGGGGAWLSCYNLVFDHCYLYQQFDCAVTPQYDGGLGSDISIFKKFIVKNCMIETSEYGLEYFTSQKGTDDNKITDMYLGYNFFRDIGKGFGVKHGRSACVKSWEHENTTYDSVIEYNIFDRPFSLSLEITGKKQENGKLAYDNKLIPVIRNNVYIAVKDRKFNRVNGVDYKFNEDSYNKLKSAGIETGSLYVFAKN